MNTKSILPKYPCAYIGQKLDEHSINTWRFGESFIKYNNWDRITFKKLSYNHKDANYTIYDIKKIMELSCILHDIGKAADMYQFGFNDACNEASNKKISFTYHEVPSSYITYYVILKKYEDEILANLSSLAVLLHIVRRDNPLNYVKYRVFDRKIWDLRPYYDYIVNNILPDVDLNMLYIRDKDAYNHIKMLRDFVQVNPILSKLHIFFLAPIIIGDNIDARERPNGKHNPWREMFTKQLLEAMGVKT